MWLDVHINGRKPFYYPRYDKDLKNYRKSTLAQGLKSAVDDSWPKGEILKARSRAAVAAGLTGAEEARLRRPMFAGGDEAKNYLTMSWLGESKQNPAGLEMLTFEMSGYYKTDVPLALGLWDYVLQSARWLPTTVGVSPD